MSTNDPRTGNPLACEPRTRPIEDRMTEIAERFPSIRRLPGVRPFDPMLLAEQYSGKSHGEALAIAFVLTIWNGCNGFKINTPGGMSESYEIRRFDLYEAWGVWDANHWRAFTTWATTDWLFRP